MKTSGSKTQENILCFCAFCGSSNSFPNNFRRLSQRKARSTETKIMKTSGSKTREKHFVFLCLFVAHLIFLVGDAPGRTVGEGLAAVVEVAAPAGCNDLMYATNCINWSSLTCP